MTVIWTVEAANCLKDIRAYIAVESPRGAEQIIKRLVHRVDQMEMLPSSGRRVPEYSEVALRELLERPYRIIYRQTDNHIEIVSVMHYRQLLPERPEDLR